MKKPPNNIFDEFKAKSENPLIFDDDGDLVDFTGEDRTEMMTVSDVRLHRPMKYKTLYEERDPETGTLVHKEGYHVFRADCNHLVSREPGHEYLPYLAGTCRDGHLVCSNCLKQCVICHTLICPHEYGKPVHNHWVCYRHVWRAHVEWLFYNILKIFFSFDLKERNDEIQRPESHNSAS